MGGNGNGNGFMGMGGNGNRNSPSRTPLVETERLRRDCQRGRPPGARGAVLSDQRTRWACVAALLPFVDVESMLDERRTLTFSFRLSDQPTDRRTGWLTESDQCLPRRESYTADGTMTFCHPPATGQQPRFGVPPSASYFNRYQTKPFASSLGYDWALELPLPHSFCWLRVICRRIHAADFWNLSFTVPADSFQVWWYISGECASKRISKIGQYLAILWKTRCRTRNVFQFLCCSMRFHIHTHTRYSKQTYHHTYTHVTHRSHPSWAYSYVLGGQIYPPDHNCIRFFVSIALLVFSVSTKWQRHLVAICCERQLQISNRWDCV